MLAVALVITVFSLLLVLASGAESIEHLLHPSLVSCKVHKFKTEGEDREIPIGSKTTGKVFIDEYQ